MQRYRFLRGVQKLARSNGEGTARGRRATPATDGTEAYHPQENQPVSSSSPFRNPGELSTSFGAIAAAQLRMDPRRVANG